MTCRIECNTPFVFLNYIQLQLPPHLQSPVHARFAFGHLQCPWHADLQEYLISSEQVTLVGVMSSMATTVNHHHVSTRSQMGSVELLILEVSVPTHILLETQLSLYVAQALLEWVECCRGSVTFFKTILDALH